ncbi:hypothetical protein THIOSC13_1030004 [uncultured Thiomicrorhabdus sp.]
MREAQAAQAQHIQSISLLSKEPMQLAPY